MTTVERARVHGGSRRWKVSDAIKDVEEKGIQAIKNNTTVITYHETRYAHRHALALAPASSTEIQYTQLTPPDSMNIRYVQGMHVRETTIMSDSVAMVSLS